MLLALQKKWNFLALHFCGELRISIWTIVYFGEPDIFAQVEHGRRPGSCKLPRMVWCNCPVSQSRFWTKLIIGWMFVSLWVAASKILNPTTCCSFFQQSGVSSFASVDVAQSAVSTTLATISSWLPSSYVPHIVGGASFGKFASMRKSWGSTPLPQYSYC